MKKRLISVLLAVALLLTVATTAAGAIETSDMENAAALTLGEATPASIPTAGGYLYYTYTPEVTCKFAFYSTGSADTYGYLFNSSGTQLIYNDDGGKNRNFRIEYILEANTTYYFGARFYSENNTGDFTVTLEQIHNYTNWTTVTAATCTAPGEESGTCSCGATTTRTIDALGHNWGAWVVTTPPTCTEAGEETATCSRCQETKTQPKAATGHTWEAPSSNSDGTHTFHCQNCTETKTEDCDYQTVVENGIAKHTCTLCSYSFTEEASGELPVVVWGFEDGTDGWQFVDADGDGRNWDRYRSDVAYEGSYSLRSDSYISSIGGLNPDNWAISPAFSLMRSTAPVLSVRATGKRDSSYFKEVFALYAGTTADPAQMTKLTDDITTTKDYMEYTADLSAFSGEPTVYIAVRHYNVYDMYYLDIDNVAIRATVSSACDAHELVLVPPAEATCTVGGHDQPFYRCEACGKTYSDAAGEHPVLLSDIVNTPALGHDWSDWETTTAPDCTNPGVETAVCSRCSGSKTREIDPLGHDWGEYVRQTDPDCVNPGTEMAHCTRCEATDTQEIPALGHSWGVVEFTKMPTCTENGLFTIPCTRCSEKQLINMPARGHAWGRVTSHNDGTHTKECAVCHVTEDEDCTFKTELENGVEKHVCSLCGYYTNEEISGVQQFNFWDFENNATGWRFVDKNSDGYNWSRGTSDTLAYEGKGLLYSSSYINNVGAITPDNWAVSPAISVKGCTEATLSLQARGADSSDYAEVFAIYAGTTDDPDQMTKLTDDYTTAYNYQEFTADLSAFTGEDTLYFAIRHYNCTNMYHLLIDNVEVTGVYSEPCGAGNHTMEHLPGAAATCVADAYTDYYHCTVCGRLYSDAAGEHPVFFKDLHTDPALGHDWGEWSVSVPVTCTEDGYETCSCSRCDATQTRLVEAIGHDWHATYNGDDTHTRVCQNCQETVTEACEYEIKLQNGVKRSTCTVCEHTFTEDVSGEQKIAGWYFEDTSDAWQFYDADQDGYNWEWYSSEDFKVYEGEGFITSASYDNETRSKLTPDNWAVSPAFSLVGCTDAHVSLYAVGQDNDDNAEVFAIYAGTSINLDQAVKVSEDYTTTGSYQNFTADLSAFIGEPEVYIAIRHYNCTDMFRLNVDQVEVFATVTAPCADGEHDLTFVPAVEPTVLEKGNIAYYRCEACGRYYLDAAGTQPVLPDDVVLPTLPVPYGDVDGNGRISIKDVTMIQRHLAEFIRLTGVGLLAADTFCDGSITIWDATYLQSYLAEYDVILGRQIYA